jgi:myo-inositol-1(or 4)-monophosphatase
MLNESFPALEKRTILADSIAVETGDLLLEYFQLKENQTEIKPDRTLVTEADLAADALISDTIQKQFPEDSIISEEGQTQSQGQEYIWVIDPLDGTTNFSQRLHYWGVSIAILRKGIPVYGIVHFPAVSETFSARAGEGALLNNQMLSLSPGGQKQRHAFFMHCSRMHQQYQSSIPYKTRSLGAAAYHLCSVAKGTAILAFESRTHIWDFAAGWLIITEAGGVIESYQQSPPFPTQTGLNYNTINYPLIGAVDKGILEFAKSRITEIEK